MVRRKGSAQPDSRTIYDLQAEICSALAHPVRLHILDLLGGAEKTATEILREVAVPKANLSQHLAVLREAGIIQARREGLYQFYSLAIPRIKEACSLVRALLLEKISQQEKKNTELMRELRAQR